MNNEEYKNIPGYEDYYEVSNYGNVRIKQKRRGGKLKPGTLIKPKIMRDGYLMFRLSLNGKQKLINAHRLVASVFIENINSKKEVNHIDGNKKNNIVTNLEWVTPKENVAHAIKLGLTKFKNHKTQDYSNCHPDRPATGKENLCVQCYKKDWYKNKKTT